MGPWELVAALGIYTEEQIEEMTWAECIEILTAENQSMKCKCNNIIPQGRVNLGYKVCVECSTTEQYGCAPLINHKTGNSIQIMSSSDAARVAKMTQRRGYGTMLG